ncbi:hypothetical protein KRX57_02500 [Weeksellaceae bacterium TAE3-ERU29]|nr:hypothetical protein [Weeksellaceae bacterium TAE3-ERU29]
MKYISLFIAILILCHPLLPMTEYAMNYTYISEVLCINKEKPKMECHGKCHLGKEIAKEMNGNSQKNTESPTVKVETLFFNNETLIIKKQLVHLIKKENNHYFKEKLHSYNFIDIAIQPPQQKV